MGIDTPTIDGAMDERRDRDPGSAPDDAAADQLLARHTRALERIADPRARRNRAYATLARHGFDPETAAGAIRRAELARVDDPNEGSAGRRP
jgi:SOS response regulatory protein OraA/RecX